MALVESQKDTSMEGRIRAEVQIVARQAHRASTQVIAGVRSILARYGTDAVKAAIGDDNYTALQGLTQGTADIVTSLTSQEAKNPFVDAPLKGAVIKMAEEQAAKAAVAPKTPPA